MNPSILARVPFLADVPPDRLYADLPLLQPFSIGAETHRSMLSICAPT